MTTGIYCIENIVNNKKYVGQAVDINKRINSHLSAIRRKDTYGDNEYLINSWYKYGEENFIYYIIEECSIDELSQKEIYYIKELHSHYTENGYNISYGGESVFLGRKHSEETKRKMSENHADFSGEKSPNFGKHLSDETKHKLSVSNKGKKHGLKGVPRSNETKKKISLGNIGKILTQESKNKISLSERGSKKGGKSLYEGVCFVNQEGLWISRFWLDNKRVYLGGYKTELEAAIAHDLAKILYFGYDCKLNLKQNIQLYLNYISIHGSEIKNKDELKIFIKSYFE